MTREWYTGRELADLRLPGLPTSERRMLDRAARETWTSRERQARGGGREYHVSALPQAARRSLGRRLLQSPATSPAAPSVSTETTANLRGWQRSTMDARALLLLEMDRLQAAAGLSRSAAAIELERHAQDGTLRPDLAAAAARANARRGESGDRTLSRTSLLRWAATRETGPSTAALAPREATPKGAAIPAWAPELLALYGRPQKPSLRSCLDDLPSQLPAGLPAPSYDQAKRFLASMSVIDRNRGRMGARALRSMRAFVVRDYADLWPTAIYVADGHTFDAETQHPIHGQPFRPEVTIIIDVATRAIVGWSIGLAENTWGVADAMRHAFSTRGVPAIWYVDRGSGFNNALMDDPSTGFVNRLGVTKRNSIAFNSQARGVVERAHQSCLVRAAKKLPSYMGAAMDAQARQRVFKITRAEVKLAGRSRHLMPWADFLAFIGAEVDAYNDRRHSELGRSPNEQWARLLREQPDTVVDRLGDAEADDAFRPYEQRITHRGQVELFGKVYFLRDLEHMHGEPVRVGYDLHDASRVWVRTLDDRLLGKALRDGNKRPWMPETRGEQLQAVRTKGRLGRLQRKVAEVEAELNGGVPVLDHRPATTFDPAFLDAADRQLAAIEAVSAPAAPAAANADRPVFADDVSMARWVLDHPDRVTPRDRLYLRSRLSSPSFRLQLETWDLDPDALSALCREVSRRMKPVFVSKVSNVRAWMAAFEQLLDRGASESCLMLVDGEPGLGKTRTAAWWAIQHNAVRVRAKQGWTQCWALQDLFQAATGKPAPGRASGALFRAVADALTLYQSKAAREGRTPVMVIDEADHAAASGKAVLETIRDLTDLLEIPTVLVGMDRLDRMLGRYPQVASRISQKVRFQTLTLEDVAAIIAAVCQCEVKEDLVAFAHRACGGYTRELKEAIAAIERHGVRNAKVVGVDDMRGLVLLHDRRTGAPIVVG